MLLVEAQKFLEVVNKRGKAKKELRRVYSKLCTNKELYLRAYANLYANKGAMTPGVDPEDTVDGMSLKRIDAIMEKLKRREYVWKPVRKIYIPKKDGVNKRPIGMPGWTDKILQEVIRMVLEAYYEPQFRDSSHGFRPNRGCHTALDSIAKWTGTRWFIEGDIKGCFNSLDWNVMLGILRRHIKDETFLRLIRDMLQAGYMDDWKYFNTYSGTPQGGIISPLLMNIVLNELDCFVEDELIPKHTKGKRRKKNPEYAKLTRTIQRMQKKGNWKGANMLRKLYSTIPFGQQDDPDFRRLWYVRYADDTLLGYIGTKAEAEAIKQEFGNFIASVKLEMSEEKTLITNARTGRARFLNYEINRMMNQSKKTATWNGRKRYVKRTVNGKLWFSIPRDVIKKWKAKVCVNDNPRHRGELMNLSDYDIISTYEVELQGLINYYSRAHNQARLSYLRYLWKTSLTKTLAAKYKTNVKSIIRKYFKYTPDKRKVIGVEIQRTDKKPLRATFGKKPIQRVKHAIIKDTIQTIHIVSNELITRLLATVCELCGKEDTTLIGHHVRKLKDLQRRWKGRKEKPAWVKRMIAIRRKVLFVCPQCHYEIHNGIYDGKKIT
jgi:group II intron reverse transcriptase/maturase